MDGIMQIGIIIVCIYMGIVFIATFYDELMANFSYGWIADGIVIGVLLIAACTVCFGIPALIIFAD